MILKIVFFIIWTYISHIHCSAEHLLKSVDFKSDNVSSPVEFKLSNNSNEVFIDFIVKDDWHLYSEKKGNIGYPFHIEVNNIANLKDYKVYFPESHTMKNSYNDISYIYDNKARLTLNLSPINSDLPIKIEVFIEYGTCREICAVFSDTIIYTVDTHNTMSSLTYLLIFFLAIFGGFILNFMPCVLPVLSIKIMSIIKSKERIKFKNELLCTALGIMSTFIIFAFVIIFLRSIGVVAGWGMHFHEPIFLIIIIIILILITHNLLGNFEIKSEIINILSKKLILISEQNLKYLSNFINGVLATLLATPCVIPTISTTVAFSITQNSYTILAIYIFMGFGMSLPYIFMIIFPKILRIFPKPGHWMITMKKIIAIAMLCTALWMLYALYQQILLKNFIIFVGIIIAAEIIATKFKYKQYIATLVIIMSCIITSNTFIHKIESVDNKYLNSHWIKYNQEELNHFIKDGEIILLDVTASWCMNCQYNKYITLNKTSLIDFFKKHEVILVQADYTKKSQEISDLIRSHNRIGIPMNLVYCTSYPNGILLPELLSEANIKDAVMRCID